MIDYKASCKSVLKEVRSIVLLEDVSTHHPDTVDREVVKLLGLAWAEAVRAEWQTFVDADPELKAQHAVALELMREDGYTMEQEPICGLPGVKPMVAVVDGKEAVCVDYSMAQVTPLSAIYVNKVRLVQSAAARVAKTLAEEAVKTPPEWPVKTAAGEVFTSIEQMEASTTPGAQEMARMMRDAGMAACHPGFEPPVTTADLIRKAVPLVGDTPFITPETAEPSCWQYFGFDGPVSLDELQKAYLGKVERESVPTVANAKLAGEAHQQYQNCLKDLASMMNGPAVTIGEGDAC